MIDLPTLWDQVEGPEAEVERFRLELLWQEYARHLYARLGSKMKQPLRFQPTSGSSPHSWDDSMGCVEITTGELEDDGWLVGQSRLWLASQWAVRQGGDWRAGEDYFFRHLLDGSRAANLLGWQTAIGSMNGKAYNFTRWQVESRAPGLCASCERNTDCPIDRWPDRRIRSAAVPNPLLRRDNDLAGTTGPTSTPVEDADVVWMTAESMGDADPAAAAHPDAPVVFVFDRPLLSKLQLSSKRLVFMVETLAELATRRQVEVHLGSPAEALEGRRVATTFAPVPGWKRHAAEVDPVAVHPWRWLRYPGEGNLSTFGEWHEQVREVDCGAARANSKADAIPVTANLM